MNTNWSKILLFSLLFGAVGFILGRVCGPGCMGDTCEKGRGMEHHGACPGGGGHCGKGGHMGGCSPKDERCEKDVQGMVDRLRQQGYQGDTTVNMGCCTVNVGIHGDRTSVEVQMTKRDTIHVDQPQ